jgi:hypothetical protein
MIIYNDFLIITPNKCGTNSVTKFFLENISRKDNYVRFGNHLDDDKNSPILKKMTHAAIVPENVKHLKKVIMVRNPYERFISIIFSSKFHYDSTEKIYQYLDHIKDTQKEIKDKLDYLRSDDENSNYENEYKNSYNNKLPPKTNLKYRLSWLMTLGQYAHLSNPDYLVRLENVIIDFKNIGINIDNFFHENITESKININFKDFYSDKKILDFANEYFECAKDALKFGYTPIYSVEGLENYSIFPIGTSSKIFKD